jgi:cyclopropane fatty-acyl-phospholipid synthase-like methyltransferase
MPKEKAWWEAGFFEDFQPVFGIIPARNTNAQVRFLIKKMGLQPGMRFLDCPCGVGRIALPLARKGIKVTGVDITQPYLDEMMRKARRARLPIEAVRADMRRIKFDCRFDAAANMWTSFGYFGKESEDLLVFKRAFAALKRGGKFLLHAINRDWILSHFQPSDWLEVKGMKVLEKRSFDYATSTSKGTWYFIKNGRETKHEISIRHYAYHELIRMLEKAGFMNVEGYGSPEGEPISRDSNMMYIFADKPPL